VGDSPAFGRAMRAVIQGGLTGKASVRHTTYDSLRGILTPKLIRNTDLFVLELWRTYSTGLRAEGLVVWEELRRQHALSLIVSPLAVGSETDTPFYWDLASENDLEERCRRLLGGGFRVPSMGSAEQKKLKSLLRDYLAKPAGHDAGAPE